MVSIDHAAPAVQYLERTSHQMKPIRILLADDHALVRGGIRSLLEKLPMVEVVGETSDGREAVKQVRELQPDLVLMDVGMPGLNGLEATQRISKEFPNVRVLILSMYANEEYVLRALRVHASGYLLKKSATAELERAIHTVAKGEIYLSPSISKQAIEDYLVGIDDQRGPLEQLTPRQREILQLIAEGETNKGIAYLLNVSVKTVEAHRTQLMKQLGIHEIAGLVRYAIRTGLVPTDE